MQNELHVSRSSTENDFVITSEDDFVIVNMYPRPVINTCNPPTTNTPSNMLPYSLTPNPSYPLKTESIYPTINAVPTTTQSTIRESCHPLQGIPFKLAPALEITQNIHLDPELEDVKRTLERVKNLLDSKDFDYDCTLERTFLREVEPK